MVKMKSLCGKCKYCKIEYYPIELGGDEFLCRKNKIYKYSFFEKNLQYGDCKKINKNNDCKDFELKPIYEVCNKLKNAKWRNAAIELLKLNGELKK